MFLYLNINKQTSIYKKKKKPKPFSLTLRNYSFNHVVYTVLHCTVNHLSLYFFLSFNVCKEAQNLTIIHHQVPI